MINGKRILRVFPKRTLATPDDGLARVGSPTLWDNQNPPDAVLVSVAWTWEIDNAEQIAGDWSMICKDVDVGGPAYNHPGADFWPGYFIKQGYTITSRGCPNSCWFCNAWKSEGREIRELPIMPGHNILDNNLLACSRPHVAAVFSMLEKQKQRPEFTGGLEAARLKDWHVSALVKLKPVSLWFACDTPDDYEPLVVASKMLKAAGLMKSKKSCCYVLAGWNRDGRFDTISEAEERVKSVVRLGYYPQAMLYDDGRDWTDEMRREWKDWSSPWIHKASVGKRMKKILAEDNKT